MSYNIIFRNRAVEEMGDAYQWYEQSVLGLGDDFLNTIEDYTDKIVAHPNQFKTTYKNFKEIYIRRFPFIIVYLVDDKKQTVLIFSVFHTSKNPKRKFKKN